MYFWNSNTIICHMCLIIVIICNHIRRYINTYRQS